MEPFSKNLNKGGRESEAEDCRVAPPSQPEVEHPTARPKGKSVKGNTAYNTLTRWITGAASTKPNGGRSGWKLWGTFGESRAVSEHNGGKRPKGENGRGRRGHLEQGCPSSGSASSSLPQNLTAESAGVRRRKDADSIPPVNQAARKRPNIEPEIIAARMVDPLTSVIVCKGYPDEELTHQQLALQTEINKIPNGPSSMTPS
ncbi:hypothetical protein TSAR_004034 [Trichomalopsis sarcophagae]|uniref:Uncharacterized protein n=1 Tax=Trichomalopsis sarcophagae TaxID=543379 RepID=A0A232EI54_9HYME|nr:hypothetical protein TSAR_004034 [Trichomalopsis sarcophagae]